MQTLQSVDRPKCACPWIQPRPSCVGRYQLSAALAAAAITAAVAAGCTSASMPATAPAPPPGSYPQLAGRWTGTLESTQFDTRPVTMLLSQSADCVDGAWQTTTSPDWQGAVSGFARPGSFAGFLIFNGDLAGSGLCAALGNISGETTDNSITWKISMSGDCPGGVSQTVTFRLHR